MDHNQLFYVKGIEKHFSGKKVFIFFLLTLAIYLYMYFFSMPYIAIYTGGMPIFDLKAAGYDYFYAIKFLETLGEEGRSLYLFPQLTLDMFFPLVYVPFLVLLSGLFLTRSRLTVSFLCFGLFIPVLTGMTDYGENISAIFMIRSYPDISEAIVRFASICTMIKSAGLILSFFLVILYCIIFLFRRKRNGKFS